VWWNVGGWKRSFFNRPNIPLRFTVKRPYTNTYTHIYLNIYIYIYNIINDKKPVSCPGTIKMWQAAVRPLAFAFFSRTRAVPSLLAGTHRVYTYIYTYNAFIRIGTFLLLLFYVLATTIAVAHKKCSLILCFWTANSYWGLYIPVYIYIIYYIYVHTQHTRIYRTLYLYTGHWEYIIHY